MDKQPLKIGPKIRPPSAIDRLNNRVLSTPLSSHISVPPDRLIINERNVRDTFKSLADLSAFMDQIGWPEDALRGGLEDPLEWIEQLKADDIPGRLDQFKRVVQLALSIEKDGQLQAVGGVPHGDKYRIILGSTRVMACSLLDKNVELRIMTARDTVSELRAHLAENLNRENLTFAEATEGYLRLFQTLLDAGEIKQISISQVMKYLGLSRTHSRRWRSVLVSALNDTDYRTRILNGTITSLEKADALTRTKQPSQAKTIHCSTDAQDMENGGNRSAEQIGEPDRSPTGMAAAKKCSDKVSSSSTSDKLYESCNLEVIERLLTSLFRTEAEFQVGIDTQVSERIHSYISSRQSRLTKPSDAFVHFQWLIDTVCDVDPIEQ